MHKKLWLWVIILLLVVPTGPARAQTPAPPCSQENGPAGCLDVTLTPATLLGDLYVDGVPLASQVNTTRLAVAPGVPHLIEVKNVTDATAGFGDLFVYGEASKANVMVGEAKVLSLALKPPLTYLKGYARFTCDVKAWTAGQDVTCQPAVEGVALPPVSPGASADFAIATGARTLHVDLLGAQADLWSPAALDLPVTIVGGKTVPVRATFNRKGLLSLAPNVPTVTGDFYVDEQLIAAQMLSATTFVAPGNHKVEIRNVVDPAANGVYRYPDASATAVAVANQNRPVTLRLVKEYLLGFGQLTCKINGVEAGQDVRCNVVIDGNGVGTLEAGQAQTYNLTPGPHTFNVSVVGGNADLWAPAAQDLPLAITAGKTSPLIATFNRKGQLTLNLSVADVVGDFYVDEQQVAAQVPNVAIFVAPGNHKVEVRNMVDPAANGVYRYPDASATAVAVANQSRPVTLRLVKEYLLGFGQLTCKINGLEAGQDVRCNVTLDGNGVGTLEAGQAQTYNLTPGPHTLNVSVVGGNADLWAPTAQDLPLTIAAGKTAPLIATFNRRGILNLRLNDPNVVADFFLDGNPVAGQVNATQVIVEPNVRHTVEARTLRNVTAPDAFEYDNLSQLVTVAPNQTRDLILSVGRPRERCTGSMALLRVVNWLRSTLFLQLAGPESKTISVPTGGEARVCVLPGTYTITQSAAGYYTEVDTQSLGGGCILYRFWPSGGAAPPSDGCSNNPGDYRRP